MGGIPAVPLKNRQVAYDLALQRRIDVADIARKTKAALDEALAEQEVDPRPPSVT